MESVKYGIGIDGKHYLNLGFPSSVAPILIGPLWDVPLD